MKIVVPAETTPGERRVAATAETVRQLVKAGLDVVVQSGAGVRSGIGDADYEAAGAAVVRTIEAAQVDVLLHVRPLHPKLPGRLRRGAITVGFDEPATHPELVTAFRDAGTTAFAMELVPRISRAQAMDALTSQALVAGYHGALEAAVRSGRFFPLTPSSAGMIPPAKVLVLGAGVAGLQIMSVVKRLGAAVSGYDVREASESEITSVGATFLDLGLDPVPGDAGYARELTPERAARQRELLEPHLAESDVVITAAVVAGRPSPELITRAMIARMKPGSVVVDLSAASGQGPNVEGAEVGEEVPVESAHGGTVIVVAPGDGAIAMPADASRLYAKNVANLVLTMTTATGQVEPDWKDEIIAGAVLTHDGQIRHQPTAQTIAEPNLAQ